MLPVSDMLLFVDVIKLKSFSATAQKHGITAAAVSKRISSLEDQLDTKLLLRSTRNMVPTDAGNVLYQYCSKIYFDINEAYHAVLDIHRNPIGDLIISAPTNFSNLVLAPIVANFVNKHPGINCEVLLNDSKKPPALGECDLAIRSGTLTDSRLISKKLMDVEFVVCATPTYYKKHGEPKTPRDLVEHNCIDYNYRQGAYKWIFFDKNKEVSVSIKGSIKANNALFVKFVTLNSLGLACLPEFMVAEEIKEGQLAPCLNDYKKLSIPVSIIYPHAKRYLPKKISLFLDYLYHELNKGK